MIIIAAVLILFYIYSFYIRETKKMTNIIGPLYLSNWEAAVDPDLLKKNNITRVICLNERHKSPDELQMYRRHDIDHHHFSIPDVPKAAIHLLFNKCEHLIRSAPGNVLIHCTAGVSRSVTIVLMYLVRSLNMSVDDALGAVRQKRPIVCPNPGFTNQLKQFA